MKPKLFDNADEAIRFMDSLPTDKQAHIIHCGCHMMVAYRKYEAIECVEVVSVDQYMEHLNGVSDIF
jgi:hypothetical protein